ncbi:MAG: glycosyltransferase family 2 protein [Paludibacteraceae bacterium]|nr:glycosyltransferase family 2 protein [Paludibacteraceae bacterium]
MDKLSAVIITYNEERNIGKCLDSVKNIADEIVVVDSYSSDKTQEICELYGVRFFQRGWDNYSAQKNYANGLASFDYVLSLDADEILSKELSTSIEKAKEHFDFDAYKFNRLTFFCGSPIRHCGWYPDRKIRLWNKNHAEWKGSVHENLTFDKDPKLKYLFGDLLHYTSSSIYSRVEKVNNYSDSKADDAFVRGKSVSLFKIMLKPLFKFFGVYIIKRGFLDGFSGFLVSMFAALDSFLFLSKLRLMKMINNKNSK